MVKRNEQDGRARVKAKHEGFEAQCGLEEPTMSRVLGNNSDEDACEDDSTDLSYTRYLHSAQIDNPFYGRSASKDSRNWTGRWCRHSGHGYGFSTGWGRDRSRHS